MIAEEMWKKYCNETGQDPDKPHEAWAFGSDPDELAQLVVNGTKTATASGYDLYFLEGEEEPLPKPGDYSIILDSQDNAVCVIRTVSTRVLPFDEVDADHAYKEGEGDRSLAYWRRVHDAFFREDFAECGVQFTHESRILLEEFEVCFKNSD